MIGAALKAIQQLMTDPRLQRTVLTGAAGAIGVFVLLTILGGMMLSSVVWAEVPWIGWMIDYLGWFFDALSAFAFGGTILLVIFFLFPPVMTAIVGIFLDDVCAAVEDRFYPGLGEPRFQPTMEVIWGALKFLAITLIINILALPLYILTIWVLGLGGLLFYLINGYLIGREFFELVAHRRMEPAQAAGLRRAHRGKVMLAGVLITFAMTVPFVNLVAPVLAAAMMVHVFMGLSRRGEFMDTTSTGTAVAEAVDKDVSL